MSRSSNVRTLSKHPAHKALSSLNADMVESVEEQMGTAKLELYTTLPAGGKEGGGIKPGIWVGGQDEGKCGQRVSEGKSGENLRSTTEVHLHVVV